MKKNFIITALLIVVFLWLGNYSFAEVICDDNKTKCDYTSQCNCDEYEPELSSLTSCKCITPTTTSCPDWTKKIDNVCEPCNKKWVCCGISLNTSVPFIGKCIEDTTGSVSPDETWVTWDQAFPVLMWSLTKILVTVILILSFVLIVIGGIMIATGDPSGGKKMIIRVVIGIALLGASGVILRLINPNFFG